MSKREERLRRILAKPPQADCEDVQGVLEDHGWSLARQKGSHLTFRKHGEQMISTAPVYGGKVKRKYPADLCDLLGLDD